MCMLWTIYHVYAVWVWTRIHHNFYTGDIETVYYGDNIYT